MAVKFKLTKAEFEKLAEHFKAEYKEDGDGYVLDLEGAEDTGALKRAKERESVGHRQQKQRADDLESQLKEVQSELDGLYENGGRQQKDVKTLTDAHKAALNQQKTEYEGKLTKLQDHIKNGAVSSVVNKLAGELSDSPKVLLPHLKGRVTADFDDDGQPVVRFLDADGQVSSLDYDGLKKEFLSNKDYAPIIRASKATGAGGSNAADTRRGGAQNLQLPNQQTVDRTKMNPAEMVAHLKAKAEANQG